jgi:acyl carrier protein
MANQTFHVLDADLEPRPDWTPGDLFIGGIGLARGYWRNPAKTAARFVVHPRTGQRLYRTGDLGRYLPDGEIEFLGREDFQVKIQGYRIELGEIETALRQHPAVDAAVVSAAGDPRTGRRLVGYIVPRGTRSDDADGALGGELADYLRARLPDYMVPTAFVTLDALPLSANGKVDRKALPEPRPPRSARPPSDPAALPAVHRRVLEILGEVLEQDSLSLEDNFFDLGGSSLSAINAHAKLCHAFGRDLPVTLLFQHATIHDLAEHIDREVAAGDGQPVAGVRRTRDYGVLRRTTLQRRAARRGTRKEDTL